MNFSQPVLLIIVNIFMITYLNSIILIYNSSFFSIIIFYLPTMMILNSFKHLIYQFDMFCSSELLRYRSQTQHKTLTGGLLSLVIICVVVGGFANMVGDTLNRVAITSTLVTQKMQNPPLVTLQPGSDKMFMLGISIRTVSTQVIDLSSGPQYFQISAHNYGFANGAVTKMAQIALEPCTRQHWSMVPDFAASYDSYQVASWLCFPLGSQITLQGSYTSSVYSFSDILVSPCHNSTSNNKCAPQADIDALFSTYKNFYLAYNYVNPVINPNQQEFISYYVEGNDYIIFSPQIGAETWLLFSDFTITSDQSILPYTDISTVTGSLVEHKSIPHPFAATEGVPYAKLLLSKSDNSLSYQRENQKISAVLSYMGGLVGAITAVLFLVKSYTDTSLEIAIGLSLFEINKEQRKKTEDEKNKGFNLFGYFQLSLYRLVKIFSGKEILKRAKLLEKCRQEAVRQMDVQLLLKRMIKLETCMTRVLTPQQLREVKEGQSITFKSARNMRMLLLKKQEQGSSDEQESPKEENEKKEEDVDDIIESHPYEEQQKEGWKNQHESGTSIYRIRLNKCSQLMRPSQMKIQEVKTVTRKTILKKKRQSENAQAQGTNNHEDEKNSRNPNTQLPPIIF